MAAAAAQNGASREPLPNSSAFDNIHCTHPQVNGYILYKNLKELNLPGPREPGGAYLPKNFMPGHNFCYRCGFWYKKRHNISVCDTKRGPRLKGVVSFAHGALSVDQNQGIGPEPSENLPHPESWDFQSFRYFSIFHRRSSVTLTLFRRSLPQCQKPSQSWSMMFVEQ